ncbi:hypothetical protein SRABI128_05393 [Microbacterium sp. Bi128]|nr:hypothetical protein SRABI128_05393 [Microbacterium sp. Bi128]
MRTQFDAVEAGRFGAPHRGDGLFLDLVDFFRGDLLGRRVRPASGNVEAVRQTGCGHADGLRARGPRGPALARHAHGAETGEDLGEDGYIVLVHGIDHAPQARNEFVAVEAHQGLERCLLAPALGGYAATDDQQPCATACPRGEERDCLIAGMAVPRRLEDGHGAKHIAVLDCQAVDFPGAGKHFGDGCCLGGHLFSLVFSWTRMKCFIQNR